MSRNDEMLLKKVLGPEQVKELRRFLDNGKRPLPVATLVRIAVEDYIRYEQFLEAGERPW